MRGLITTVVRLTQAGSLSQPIIRQPTLVTLMAKYSRHAK